jgi:methionine-R-sulfoxide reductase
MRVKKLPRRGAYNNRVSLAIGLMVGAALAAYLFVPMQPGPKPVASNISTAPSGETVMVNVCVFNDKGELTAPVSMAKVVKSEAEWKKQLTPEQYRVTRDSGTERAFCGNLLDNKLKGVYTCVCCRLPLFSSNAKFESGSGWPSFFQPICKENVAEKQDVAHGMVRVEINCARCDAHLGHVFEDGPRPTGLLFCLNSESLEFTENKDLAKLAEGGK